MTTMLKSQRPLVVIGGVVLIILGIWFWIALPYILL